MSSDAISRAAVRAAVQLTESALDTPVVERRERLMGGHGKILLVGGTWEALDEAFAFVDTRERLWTRFEPTSDFSRLNWAEGSPTRVDPSTVALIREMIAGWKLTDGDYDPTMLPRLLAAGYTASVNDPTRVTTLPDSARAHGDPAGIVINGHEVTLPLGTTLDAGGIGKGYTADLVCQLALDAGIVGVMAEMGGDLAVAGTPPDGVAWRIGIEDPFETDKWARIVRLARGAVATSSQRKRRWASDSGERHHLIDPRSGASAQTGAQTVSVIAATAAKAEVLAKSGFLRPADEYLEWLPTVGAAGFIIDESGETAESPNWKRYEE